MRPFDYKTKVHALSFPEEFAGSPPVEIIMGGIIPDWENQIPVGNEADPFPTGMMIFPEKLLALGLRHVRVQNRIYHKGTDLNGFTADEFRYERHEDAVVVGSLHVYAIA